jgi:uncharacterized protein YbjQ (UPF0145 family)
MYSLDAVQGAQLDKYEAMLREARKEALLVTQKF